MNSIIKEFNLPNYIKGKSFAQASKLIDKKFQGRNDKSSLDTKEELLSRLAKAQEYIKMQQSLKTNSEELPTDDFNYGGTMQDYSPMENEPAEKTKDAIGSIIPIAGLFRGVEKAGVGIAKGQSEKNGTISQSLFDPLGGAAKVGKTEGGNFGKSVASFLLPGLGGTIINKDNERRKAEASMNNTYVNRNEFDSDFALGGFLNDKDKDKKLKKEEVKEVNESTGIEFEESTANRLFGRDTSDMQSLGDLDLGRYKDVGYYDVSNDGSKYTVTPTERNKHNYDNYKNNLDYIKELNPGVEIEENYKDTNSRAFGGALSSMFSVGNGLDKVYNSPEAATPDFNVKEQSKFAKRLSGAGDWLKDNAGNILSYAPALSNLIEMAKLKKATTARGDRLDNKYNRQLFDEEALVNKVNQNDVNSALTESSGGNLGALRTNILAANLNKTKAISDGMIKGQEINRGENRYDFDTGMRRDQINARLNEAYIDRKARDEGAFNTTKANYKAAVAEDIGKIGQDIVNKDLVREMYGYTWDGRYFVNEEGDKLSESEMAARVKANKTNQSMYGSYLLKN